MITTTLNKIRKHQPCQDGWENLLKSLGKTQADDEVLTFSSIIESNGLDYALWCLRSVCPEYDKEVRLFAADCAESVLYIFEESYPEDKRPRLAIEAARAFANGEIDASALEAAAGAAAWAAVWAAGAARAAAWAARAAAGAARAAAGAAAWAAVWAAGAAGADAQIQMIKDRFS